MKQLLRLIHTLSLITLFSGLVAMAQTTGARLTGSVADSTGAAIRNAHITATNVGTNLTLRADSDGAGNYFLPSLPPGEYTLTAEADGFQRRVQNGIALTVGQNATLNIVLHPGSATQTVTITGGAEIINATTAEISQAIGETSIKELPLNGRDPSSLVFLTTGVTNELQSQASTLPTSNSFPTESGASAGGGRQGSTWYLLDGVPNIDTYSLLAAPFPNADATQEFRVISNNFDARYGFAPSAVVEIQTKSGTNEFHGGLFEFIRNNDLNASNYFTHAVDPLKRNQFGGYIGGPVLKNKLFFFANYQGTRASLTSSSNPTYTPTAAMLNGDFSAVPTTLPAPFATVNGKPNQVNTALFSPGALKIAQFLPLGGDPSTGLTNYVNPAQRYSFDEGTARLDYTVNGNQRIFLRNFTYSYDQPGTSLPENILAGVTGQHGIYLNEAFNHTWTISPTLLNSFTFAYSSIDYDTGTVARNGSGNPVCLSEFIAVSDPVGSCYIGGFSVVNGNGLYGGGSGFSAFTGSPVDTKRRDWILTETITKTFGNHTFVAGADVLHRYEHESSGSGQNPIVGITGQYTGSALADFLLGDVSTFSQVAGESGSTHGWMFGLYAQDQYKIRPNVTLNAGLRWDPNTPPGVVGGRGAAFIPGQQSTRYPNAPIGLVFPGDRGIDSALMPTTYGYFEPRIGIAWQPRPNTAVRAGFGLFTTPLEDAFYNHVWDAAPFAPAFQRNGTPPGINPDGSRNPGIPINFDAPWSGFATTGGVSPFPPFASPSLVPPSDTSFANFTPAQLGAVFARNFKLGITQSWNLSIEQQITPSLAMHLAYVGSQSYHEATTVEQNPGHYSTDPALNGARITFPDFSSIIQVQDGATGTYHSLQAGIEKRFSHNFQAQSNFTWSRTTDVGGSGDPSFESSVSDPYDIGHDKGLSSLNYPIIWVSNFLYQLPGLRNQNIFAKSILGEWQLSGIWTLQSGPPFTVNGGNGNNNSAFNVGQDRADLTGQPFGVRQGGKSHWLNEYFNTAAFTTNAQGTPGNSGKFLIQEAPIDTLDLGISKRWQFQERYGLQFRWEMFNALNHPSFGQPDSNPGDANFGQITSIGVIAPRVMQGALKFTF